ncbi:hypothetical protein POJ06DRAFT_211249 [Lipomyces tetrasporus]|uniref:Amino-acid acetyltransferase, mitochondrial n=1 Tax=Lipomyces tetrasporus TaxID=54092 RepID=A0AAD7QRJ2_9ASCO|nr:uncharacterized protein POJ06DRAFT_211249 [Lipomyces tetrasporus]KAJ8099993.1 hypothetical protein POJ06DRAFT_211249 [Lipomyces tetrasporus]
MTHLLRPACLANSTISASARRILPRWPRIAYHRNVVSATQFPPVEEDTQEEDDFLESRELILSVLRSNATKRDAREYISKYSDHLDSAEKRKRQGFAKKVLRSVSEASRGFDLYGSAPIELRDMIRVAVIKIRGVGDLTPNILGNIGKTILRLQRLGMSPVIVVDPVAENGPAWMQRAEGFASSAQIKQMTGIAARIAAAIEKPLCCDKSQSPVVLNVRSQNGHKHPGKAAILPSMFTHVAPYLQSSIKWSLPHLMFIAMTNKIVPIITPLVYNEYSSRYAIAAADDIVYEIVNKISGIASPEVITLDKVIYIDPLGGIPSVERHSGAHILVNLEQEYSDIMRELDPIMNPSNRQSPVLSVLSNRVRAEQYNGVHISNLSSFRKLLAIAPPSTSGLITTPVVAASQSTRNPLIYNLLTDRPVISSSLPVDGKRASIQHTTLLRHGMPVMMIYSSQGMYLPEYPRMGSLRRSSDTQVPNGLSTMRDGVADVDLVKLVQLIENSFGRDLDVQHYLERVNGNIAGLVIAGNYEGGAIITWEKVPSNPLDHVAYLDKFAVLRRNQGSAGVADIVFKAMSDKLFPKELIWRSRTENPVNKWYFDRSKGSLRLPGKRWTMFYRGYDTREDDRLQDYIDVCTSIEPSFKKLGA